MSFILGTGPVFALFGADFARRFVDVSSLPRSMPLPCFASPPSYEDLGADDVLSRDFVEEFKILRDF